VEPARILIVDDEPFNLDVLEQELELLGHMSVRAENGCEALKRLKDEPFDLILLDVMMPGLDGYTVLGHVKSHDAWRHIPVIMISALTDMRSIVRCIADGAEDYLPKPFEPVLLEARIGACLERKRLHDREVAHLEAIEHERRRADELLHAILPAPAVAELKAKGSVQPRLFSEVAVLFVDLVDFTAWCHAHRPEEVVADVQRLADAFETFAHGHGMEKIKTIGDAFMATANLLRPHSDPVMAAVRCARDMASVAYAGSSGWRIRAGIHIGPVVGGVVGRTKFSFDLWGDTVNVAARLSALGSEGAIHLSADAFERVRDRCIVLAVGRFPLKGKGEVEVYRCDAPPEEPNAGSSIE
jgi:class 3 adenylate cyclase/CheY-like chemotaxis protein